MIDREFFHKPGCPRIGTSGEATFRVVNGVARWFCCDGVVDYHVSPRPIPALPSPHEIQRGQTHHIERPTGRVS